MRTSVSASGWICQSGRSGWITVFRSFMSLSTALRAHLTSISAINFEQIGARAVQFTALPQSTRHLLLPLLTMHKTTVLFAALFGICLALAPSANAQMKLGIVDMNGVFTSYYKTKDA